MMMVVCGGRDNDSNYGDDMDCDGCSWLST